MNPTSAVTRPAAVAGMFYPGSPEALRDSVREFLAEAGPDDGVAPKVLIVPHAGYVYSGSTAARAYATLRRIAAQVRRVVVIGPAHRVAVRGVAIPSVDRFETPLGPVDLDRAVLDALAAEPHVVRSDRAHAAEHALEVQLPFLQEVLEDFTLVPLVVGDATPDEVAAVLERVWGGPETLIVVSSDLSHYLPYDTARRVDAATLAQVLALGPELDHEQACGATPINALMHVARRRACARACLPHAVQAIRREIATASLATPPSPSLPTTGSRPPKRTKRTCRIRAKGLPTAARCFWRTHVTRSSRCSVRRAQRCPTRRSSTSPAPLS